MIWHTYNFSLANKIGGCILNTNVQFKTSSKNMKTNAEMYKKENFTLACRNDTAMANRVRY
jgi:hypothetical protein